MLVQMIYLGLALTAVQGPNPQSPRTLDRATQQKIQKLKEDRCDALKKALVLRIAQYREGFNGRGTTHNELARVSRRLLKAELDAATKPAQRVTAHALHLEMMKLVEKIAQAGVNARLLDRADVELARAARLKAEMTWLAAGGKNSAMEMLGKGLRTSKADKELLRAIVGLAAHLERQPKEKRGKEKEQSCHFPPDSGVR